jgi:hypothetical protein
MTALPDRVVGDARTSDFGWDLLTDLTDIGSRMAVTVGERRGAERVVAAFEEAGLRNAGLDEFEIPGWWRGESAIELSGPVERRHERSHEVIALPGTPADEVTAPLVDVGEGTDDQFDAASDALDGAIAMASSDTPESRSTSPPPNTGRSASSSAITSRGRSRRRARSATTTDRGRFRPSASRRKWASACRASP